MVRRRRPDAGRHGLPPKDGQISRSTPLPAREVGRHRRARQTRRSSFMIRIKRHWKALSLALGTCVLVAVVVGSGASAASKQNGIVFNMVRSTAAANAGCLPDAGAVVSVRSSGPTETMIVRVHGLPPKTEF